MPLLSIYGSFSYSDIATKDGYRILNHIPFYATGNEILSLYKLINLHNLDYKSFNNYCKDFQEQNKTEKIFLIDLYFTNNELFKKGCDEIIESREKIIILEPIEKDYLIEKNENFLRVYLKFIHLCEENKYEPFDAFMRFLNNININSNNMEKVPIIYKKEFHIYALKCMANEYNDKVKRYEILLSIIACKKSLKNLVDSTNQNLFEIFRYIANKCKESSYREIKFWNFISSQSIIADTKFYKQFSNKVLINYNEISIHLKEKHQKYLQNIMTYILQSNLITVITKIPKIINIIENAFSCIKNQDEKDALIFGTIISLTNNYKEEFIKYFCYCFGNFDMAIINSVNFPCFIRNKWLTIYKLFNKFVFDSNHDLKKLFYQKMFHQSIIKIYIIGDENIGKNSMIYRFFYKQFRYVVPQIIYYKLQKIFDDKLHNIYLIPINDEPKDIRKLFYPNIDVFVLCFSVANRLSFYNAKDIWYNEIKSYLSNGNLLLIGTNADFRKTKKYNCVSFEEVRNLADEINADYMECSAKEGEGIKELFDLAMKKGYQKNLMKNGSGCLVS